MKIIKILLGLLLAVILIGVSAFVAAGLTLPAERVYVNEVEINAPAEKVWSIILDRDRYTEWQPSITKVEKTGTNSWREYPKDAPEPLDFKVTKDERPAKVEMEYTMGNFLKGGWRGEITPTATGVRLKTEDKIKVEPWFSKIMTTIFFDLDSFAKDWNRKLKQHAEKS